MDTYNDLVAVGEDEQKRIDFVYSAIQKHKKTDLYQTAVLADEYDRQRNRTILQYEKTVTNVFGKIVPDKWSPNHKTTCGFFPYFLTQQNQYLLGKGIQWAGKVFVVPEGTPEAVRKLVWDNPEKGEYHDEWQVSVDMGTSDKLGNDFDLRLKEAGRAALSGGVSFGFWNLDHLEVFKVLEYTPLFDEEDGAMKAGIRFWQVASDKPLRATLYELDGYTDIIWNKNDKGNYEGQIFNPKRPYKRISTMTAAEGNIIYDGENYPTFPIVPLWANPHRQSELVGIQEQIDAYDLVKNGFLNDIDTAQLYWIIKGAGGMDVPELERFLEQLQMNHVVNVDDGQDAEAHTVEIPYAARETILNRIKSDLYHDYGALDVENLSGAATATEILAAYEPMDEKADQYEACVHQFLHGILEIIGVEDEPIFTRSVMINKAEDIQTVLSASEYTGDEYTTKKVLSILGDSDQANVILMQKEADEMDRLGDDESLAEKVMKMFEEKRGGEDEAKEDGTEDNAS